MPTSRLSLVWIIAMVGCSAVSSRARAYEEQASLDGALGVTGLVVAADRIAGAGPSVDLGAAMGLGETWVARGALGYAPLVAAHGVNHASRLRIEAAYLVDIVRWVPYAGAGASVWVVAGGSRVLVAPAIHALLGVDFLASRSLTVGADLRVGGLYGDQNWGVPVEFQVRISRVFELF